MTDGQKQKRPGRKLGAERRRVARSCVRNYILEYGNELPRKVLVSLAILLGCSQDSYRDTELKNYVYGVRNGGENPIDAYLNRRIPCQKGLL